MFSEFSAESTAKMIAPTSSVPVVRGDTICAILSDAKATAEWGPFNRPANFQSSHPRRREGGRNRTKETRNNFLRKHDVGRANFFAVVSCLP